MEEIVPKFSVYLLIFVRLASFFMTMPIFSYRTIPAQHRLGISALLAWIMYYTVSSPVFEIDGLYLLLVLKEALVGLMIGFFAYMMFSAVQTAGGFIDFQMGFSMANVIDPQTGVQSPLMGQYLYTFALLFLLAIDGHHLLLDGIFYSYEFIPLSTDFLPFGNEQILTLMIQFFTQSFIIAFQMSIPIVGSLFLVDIALGIVARTVPQMNIFVIGFPIKIFVSLILLTITMGTILLLVKGLLNTTLEGMRSLMHLLGGS
ncbi:flagellar biosynthetic protein FliR [Bacillus sp. D386]|uniref:flagellar biosynthetic protein FliR n=1 Tax=Bacillus sp. D386 TaxID=2587155 RepID=UPI00112064FC|nr:flagellar biosynthetic protein FliR [Bacillus sp. D386]